MALDSDRPTQVGDAARQEAAEAQAFLDHLRASRTAKITNAEREADKKEIADLRAKTEMLQRAVSRHAEHIREQRGQIRALTSAVAELQRQRRPAGVRVPAKRRDGLDAALEREIYD
jgi:predicted  nucleic acid-binding Zn-ribbon protein